jgi:hypothetical protein
VARPEQGCSSSEVYSGCCAAGQRGTRTSAEDAQAAADAAGLEGEVNGDGDLIITRGDDTEYNAGHGRPGRPQGPQGVAGVVTAGSSLPTQVLFNKADIVTGVPKFTYDDSANRFSIANVAIDPSNYERGSAFWSGTEFRFGVEAAGTGTARNMALLVATGLLVRMASSGQPKFTVNGGPRRAGLTSTAATTARATRSTCALAPPGRHLHHRPTSIGTAASSRISMGTLGAAASVRTNTSRRLVRRGRQLHFRTGQHLRPWCVGQLPPEKIFRHRRACG